MDSCTLKQEIAKELTLQVLQSPNAVFDKESRHNPEEIGATVAKLYNAILDNIKD